MEAIERKSRVAKLQRFILEDRLIRHEFKNLGYDGRMRACLLAALSDEVAESENPDHCPADLMPNWMANLTPWIDDAGTLERWPATIDRYANLASRWHVLNHQQWESARVEIRDRAIGSLGGRPELTDLIPILREITELVDAGMPPASLEKSRFIDRARQVYNSYTTGYTTGDVISSMCRGNLGSVLSYITALIAGTVNNSSQHKKEASDRLIDIVFEAVENRIRLIEGT